MFDPFAEKAFDAHSAALLHARPKPLMSGLAPQRSPSCTLPGVRDKKLDCTPAEIKGLRKLFEAQRKK